MKNKLKSVLALLLAALVLLPLIACNVDDGNGGDTVGNGGNGGNKQEAQKSKPTNVYKETAISLGEEVGYLYNASFYDGRLYFPFSSFNEETMVNTSSIVSIALENGDNVMRTHYSVESSRMMEEGVYSYQSLENAVVDASGNIWMYGNRTYEDYRDENNHIYESTYFIMKVDFDGNTLFELDLKSLLPDREYVYINRFMAGHDGAIYISCGDLLVVIDSETGELLFTISENSYYEGIINLPDGSVAVYTYDYNDGTSVLKKINKATKGWGDTVELKANPSFYTAMEGDGNYLFYYYDYNNGIMAIKSDGTAEEVVNFINSDIDNSSINGIYKTGDGEFIIYGYDYDNGKNKIARLTKVADADIKEAIIINYACMYLDYEIKRKIIAFNKENDEYRIQVKDYSIYNTSSDYMAGYTKLNADIIGGNIPDMMSLNGLNTANFINKGILADLYELIDSSAVADRSDYVQAVLKADESNGKLYRFTPSYAIYTVVGKESLVGSGKTWTFDELNALLARMPEGTEPFMYTTKSDVLYYMTMMTMDNYINWDTGECSFNEGFAQLLEFANTFPEKYDWDSIYGEDYDWTYYERAYKQDLVLLQMAYVGTYRAIRDYETQFGEEVNFIGFPTNGDSGSVFYPYTQYGISARSPHKQTCFDFLASIVQIEPDFSNSGGYFYGSFSLSKNYMDKVKAYELTPLKEREGYVDYNYDYDEYARTYASDVAVMPYPEEEDPDDTTANYHLTEDEVTAIDRLFTSTSGFYSENTSITNIINEEADEFFAGRKSAQQAAQLIQSRVQILVSESM